MDYLIYERAPHKAILYSPIKDQGFYPEKHSQIFVSGIPYKASVFEVAQFFQEVNRLFQVKLLLQPNPSLNRGLAYVTFFNSSAAKKAIKDLEKKLFMGIKPLKMEPSVDNCRIFVGGLPIEKSKEEILVDLLSNYKVRNLVNIITYYSYVDPKYNRGFAFLEFRSHEDASFFLIKYGRSLYLFGKLVLVDWSIPIVDSDPKSEAQIKILFVRNLDVTMTFDQFSSIVYRLMSKEFIEKVYKFKNYAYIHMDTREHAERLMQKLKDYYANTVVEVIYAKPPNKYTERNYREKALTERMFSLSTPRTRTYSRATQSSEASSLSPQYPSSSSSTLNAFDSYACPQPIHGTVSCYWNQSDVMAPVVPARPILGQTWTSPPLYQRNQCNHRDEPFSAIDFEDMVTKLVDE